MNNDCCINEEHVNDVLINIISDNHITDMSEIFRLLGDPSRLRIVAALRVRELCVGDISALMDISQSGVSHQLRLLKKNRIVKTRRDGKMIYYSLDDEHINDLLDIGLSHVSHDHEH